MTPSPLISIGHVSKRYPGVLALAESPESIVANCQEIHPTLINGVPYFWDKLERFLVSQNLADKPGKYRASIAEETLNGGTDTCGADTSPTVNHQR